MLSPLLSLRLMDLQPVHKMNHVHRSKLYDSVFLGQAYCDFTHWRASGSVEEDARRVRASIPERLLNLFDRCSVSRSRTMSTQSGRFRQYSMERTSQAAAIKVCKGSAQPDHGDGIESGELCISGLQSVRQASDRLEHSHGFRHG